MKIKIFICDCFFLLFRLANKSKKQKNLKIMNNNLLEIIYIYCNI